MDSEAAWTCLSEGAAARRDERLSDFEELYRRHAGLVRRAAYSLGGAEDLDDIVQEAFLRIWRGWESFRGQARPETWIYRVTINTAREHWRAKSRRGAAMARYLEEPRPEAAEGGQRAWEIRRAVARALESLSWEQREAVTLCYLEGLPLAEAAAIADVPEGTLKSRLHHARKQMARALGAKDEDE